MSNDNELFDGIQILSPAEIEASAGLGGSTAPEETEEDNTPRPPAVELDGADGLSIEVPERTSQESVENNDNTEPTTGQSANSTPPNPGTSRYQALIKDLQKEEIFAGVEEEEMEEMLKDASADTVKKLMQMTIDTAFKAKESSWKESFTGAKKRFLDIEDSFSDTDHAIQMAQRLEFLDNVSDEQIKSNPDLQKQLYYQYLTSKNFSNAEAISMIDEADGIDKLYEKATTALPALKTQATSIVAASQKKKQAMQAQYEESQKESYQNLLGLVDETEEFIPGLKMNKVIKEKVKKNMTSPIHQDEQGNAYTSLMYKQKKNPLAFQALMSYYDELGLFNVDSKGQFSPNIDKIKTVAKTTAVRELDQVLQAEEERGFGRANSNTPSTKQSGLLGILEAGFKKQK